MPGRRATDHFLELTRIDRKRIFNLGYLTWVEQRAVPLDVFEAQCAPRFWTGIREMLQRLRQRRHDGEHAAHGRIDGDLCWLWVSGGALLPSRFRSSAREPVTAREQITS